MKDFYKQARIDGADRYFEGPDKIATSRSFRGVARQNSKIDLKKEVEDFYTQEEIWNTCPQPDGTVNPDCKECNNEQWWLHDIVILLLLLKVIKGMTPYDT